MTIFELKEKLSKYPDDYKVIIDVSRDYEDYSEVEHVSLCKYSFGMREVVVDRRISKDSNANAVILT